MIIFSTVVLCGIDSQVLEGNRDDKLSAMLKTAVWCLTSPEKHFAEVTASSTSTREYSLLF